MDVRLSINEGRKDESETEGNREGRQDKKR